MPCWYKQKKYLNIDTESWLLLPLLKRIHVQSIQDKQYKRLRNCRNILSYLHICPFVLLVFQFHNRFYNAWKGPFHMNLDEFTRQLKSYTELEYDTRSIFSCWFSFRHEYVQLELGEDMIEQNILKALQMFNSKHSYEKLLYTLNHVKESITDGGYYKYYVKLPSNEQFHIHRRLSYNF
ncbi:unnamed protein product [Rotaria sp. Silwood2]|nr:unnamed protein product [Rotaria sp. Silwood2]CAF3309157.1 unnamed protein product [Rotaria sp. Silwood2]CAF3366831.1 unnamed protein product [Rotaria sp. Silwood2]CAF4423234.1 unnamed protein product [Rotaria sp. Silwood2]CAF4461537.1 unnamed protein product [Rotaria sp. Silwood2]